MLVIRDRKTNKNVRLYTGREVMIALGKKMDLTHEEYKKHYNDYFQLFDTDERSFDKMPLFYDEKDFYNCLAQGESDIMLANKINNDKRFDNPLVDKIYIKNIKELRNFKKKIKNWYWYFNILYGICIITIFIIAGYTISQMINF